MNVCVLTSTKTDTSIATATAITITKQTVLQLLLLQDSWYSDIAGIP